MLSLASSVISAQPGPYAVGVGGVLAPWESKARAGRRKGSKHDHKGVTPHCHSQPGVAPAWGASRRPVGAPSKS